MFTFFYCLSRCNHVKYTLNWNMKESHIVSLSQHIRKVPVYGQYDNVLGYVCTRRRLLKSMCYLTNPIFLIYHQWVGNRRIERLETQSSCSYIHLFQILQGWWSHLQQIIPGHSNIEEKIKQFYLMNYEVSYWISTYISRPTI